jgi:hypothetical protein
MFLQERTLGAVLFRDVMKKGITPKGRSCRDGSCGNAMTAFPFRAGMEAGHNRSP